MEGQPIAAISAGGIFGEMALMLEEQNKKRLATVIALTYCDMYSMSEQDMLDVLAKHPTLLKEIMNTALDRSKHFKRKANMFSKNQQKMSKKGSNGWFALRQSIKEKRKTNIMDVIREGLEERKTREEQIDHVSERVKSRSNKGPTSPLSKKKKGNVRRRSSVMDPLTKNTIVRLSTQLDALTSRVEKLVEDEE